MDIIDRLKHLSQDDRDLVFMNESTGSREEVYTKLLTEDELAFQKDELAQTSILLATLHEEQQRAVAAYKEKIMPLQRSQKKALTAIRTRSIEVSGKVWMLPDHDNQMIYTVDTDGTIVSSRRMLPEERQYRIPNMLTKAV